MKLILWRLATVIAITLFISACSDSNDDADDTNIASDLIDTATENEEIVVDEIDVADEVSDVAVGAIDLRNFVDGALVEEATIVDCTLSGGVETTCYQLTVEGVPANAAVGPFCPESINTTAADAGIWLDGSSGETFDVDGNFILNLPNIYGDTNWQLYDVDTGVVNVTDTQIACEAAARPDVDPQYQNHCVQCAVEYYGAEVLNSTVLIPTTPVLADAPSSVSADAVGITLNGVVISPPAPVSDILSNYTIAAFDDCGGHVNPAFGYHYHAATDCTTTGTQPDDHAGLLGYAMDGFGIYGLLDANGEEPTGLDECRGETDDVRGYHYHAASAWENMFIGCYSGQIEGEAGADERPQGGPRG